MVKESKMHVIKSMALMGVHNQFKLPSNFLLLYSEHGCSSVVELYVNVHL